MSRNPAPIVFFNAPMPYEVRAALKQIAAIDETSMAAVVHRALVAEITKFEGKLRPAAQPPGHE
jgi:hypothetical protein